MGNVPVVGWVLRKRGGVGMRLGLLVAVFWFGCGLAVAGGGAVSVTPVTLPPLPLGVVTLAGGKAVNLSVSAGAGAFRAPFDPPGRLWTITDRGPAIDCNEERDVIGPDDKQICVPGRRGKIYLLPTFVPSIYAVDIGSAKSARFSEMIPLKGVSGKPLTGITNPMEHARAEAAYAPDGQVLAADPSGIEPGGLVRLKDGTFFVADGFGPSLLEVAPDGTVRRRIVPHSLAEDLRDADYPVEPSLPAILSRRQVGRGFEGVAISPDEKYVFVAMQNALMNPDIEAYRASSLVRLFKIDRVSGQVVASYVHMLDRPDQFRGDSGGFSREPRPSDVRLMEIVALDDGRLLVLERFKNLSRIYRIEIDGTSDLPKGLDEVLSQQSLERMEAPVLQASGVVPLKKTLLFESDPARGPAGRLSGMAVLSDREIAVIGNNDFGIDGSRTQMFRLTFPASILN